MTNEDSISVNKNGLTVNSLIQATYLVADEDGTSDSSEVDFAMMAELCGGVWNDYQIKFAYQLIPYDRALAQERRNGGSAVFTDIGATLTLKHPIDDIETIVIPRPSGRDRRDTKARTMIEHNVVMFSRLTEMRQTRVKQIRLGDWTVAMAALVDLAAGEQETGLKLIL